MAEQFAEGSPRYVAEAAQNKEASLSDPLAALAPSQARPAIGPQCAERAPAKHSERFLALVQADRARVQAQGFIRYQLTLALWKASGILVRWARALEK
jgi:hypothetical protein